MNGVDKGQAMFDELIEFLKMDKEIEYLLSDDQFELIMNRIYEFEKQMQPERLRRVDNHRNMVKAIV